MKLRGLLPLFGVAAKIVYLTQWRKTMTSPDWDVPSPLSRLGLEDADGIPEGGFGAVAAPAGVGKTALLVQLALHAMLKDEPVLHVSLQDPVQKIGLWYRSSFKTSLDTKGSREPVRCGSGFFPTGSSCPSRWKDSPCLGSKSGSPI